MFSARIARQIDMRQFLFALRGFLAQNCTDNALSQRGSVVIEELVVNAFRHGAAERAGGVGVELEVAPSGLRGSVWHDGAPFDPSAAPPADTARDAPASGLGLHLVHGFTRSLAYSRDGETNRARFEIAPQ